jgi:hypothetical protein
LLVDLIAANCWAGMIIGSVVELLASFVVSIASMITL